MYGKLMVRSLWRHQKRGRRLFVLLALCAAALIALLTFQADFSHQYRDLFIGLKTGHLQILPSRSTAFAINTFAAQDQEVPLLRATEALDRWVKSQPEVEEAAPVLHRNAYAFNLDSEWDSWVSLVALPSDRLARLFPLARVLEGDGNLAWKPGDAEIPMLHARLQAEFGQKNADTGVFIRKELKAYNQAQMERFKARLTADFPSLFSGDTFSGAEADQKFLDRWSQALPRRDLYQSVPASRLEKYDYRIDDALVAIADNRVDALVPFWNKRLFQALYPDDIHPLEQPIVAGKSVTLQVPGLKTQGALDLPRVLPARYTGMVDIMPLYTPDSFLDLEAFRSYMDAEPEAASGYIIRLKDITATAEVQRRLEAWLATDQGRNVGDVRVADYNFLGKTYLTTATAFGVIISILIGVFVVILVVFIVNLVLMAMIQRRREIGTGIAMGLTNGQTILLMTGEVGVIVTVSFVAGSAVAVLLVAAGMVWGVPGMIFFPGQTLRLTFQAAPFFWTYLLLLPSALLAAVIPLSGLRRLLPVDFFREAR